ncbi:hypothetical protein OEZ86_008710 [Tetradesmus obliquus]|nr:hypothetical protein OEZ86_008710 [Tetradesmus obliquus]
MPFTFLVLLCLACAARHSGLHGGQGLLPSHVPSVGASNLLSQLQQQYKHSKAWKRAYKQRPSAACSRNLFGDQSTAALCKGSCSSPSTYAGRGRFSSQMITSVWKAQQHIRQYGAIVSRFDVYSDFESFYADKRNAQAVYRPSASAYFQYYHAITLVGYDNEQQYWLAKNSYGSDWGDKGLFKVAYGVCAILAADKGEAYGVVWTPSSVPDARQLPVTAGPRKHCYWYQAQPGDYLSKVAWLAGIRIDKLMLDNTDVVKDLDASLQGMKLLLCNPTPGAVKMSGSPPGPGDAFKVQGTGSDPQLEALLKIKAAIDTTGKLEEWNMAAGTSGGYCKWRGVLCNDGTTRVYDLTLNPAGGTEGLKGTLPPVAAFKGLAGLTGLDISDQPGISGTVRADWSRLGQLQDMRLGNNSLFGSIPPAWGSLSKLRVLYLFDNKLSGSIPTSFKALTVLKDIAVYNNALSGTIPDLSGLTGLRRLYLYGNKLSGAIPASVRGLVGLQELILHTNELSGTIPDLSSLTKLRMMSLHQNKLSGSIPASVGALTALEYLAMHENNISGTVPSSLSSMRSLKGVSMSRNPQLGFCLPASWRQQLSGFDMKQWIYDKTRIKGFC